MRLWKYNAHEIRDMLRTKTISVRNVAEAILDRIEQNEPSVKAYISLNNKRDIFKKVSILEKTISEETIKNLAGIPIALQDDICADGLLTTCGSKILGDFIAPYNANVVDRLYKEGCIVLGKTNMDSFCIGASTENSAYGTTPNPFDNKRVSGGAGGSAAAVAKGEAFFALGSDTAGQIRQSASYCGLVGLKPTYGLVSRYGLITHAPSLAQIGSLTKDVEDCAIVLNVIAGYDQRDGNSAAVKSVDYRKALCNGIEGLRIGVITDGFGLEIKPEIYDCISKSIEIFSGLGAAVEKIQIPYLQYILPVHLFISSVESSSALGRFDGIRYGHCSDNISDIEELFIKTRSEGFGGAEKIWMILGSYALRSENEETIYNKASRLRALIQRKIEEVFKEFDIILSPTCPTLPFKIGEHNYLIDMHKNYAYTAAANLTGLPAISTLWRSK